MKKRLIAAVAVFVVTLLVGLAVGIKGGLNRPMESDAAYFRGLAANLAAGKGFVLDKAQTFWPGRPTMRRMPAWPFAASLVFRAAGASDSAMRVLNAGISAGVALLLVVLTWRLSQGLLAAVLAGLAYAVHPSAIYWTTMGFSEPLFLLLCIGGILLLVTQAARGEGVLFGIPCGWRLFVAALLLGTASLVRANFVLMLPAYGLLALLLYPRRLGRPSAARLACLAVAALLFAAPATLWVIRNQRVCGDFPVMSTIRGQTFYGGNNALVAADRQYWGYWVFPNAIPGETAMGALSKNMSEREVDKYYYRKGKAFLRENRSAVPKLLLGKFVRAYVPIPWNVTPATLVISAYRWGLYVLALTGFLLCRRTVPPAYKLSLFGMFLTSLVTVLVFWGCARFAFAVEPFLMPFCGIAGQRAWERLRG